MNDFFSLSFEAFCARYWQQKPYLFRQAFTELDSLLEGGDLAGLACEPEVESRIIQGSGLEGPWQCKQGPFEEDDFQSLGDKPWTLLVQGVDQWLPEVRELLAAFAGFPHWRLEDIMVSYAPKGGGVGPHFDYYDVFLIQGTGSRQWQLGPMCNEQTPLQAHSEVKLLTDFATQEVHELQTGDMLYIPAGMAHWGTATSDDCITYSIGFRAPSEQELLAATLEQLMSQCSNHKRYRDPVAITSGYEIDAKAQSQITSVLAGLTPEKIQQAALSAFAQLVTEPRYPAIEPEEEINQESFEKALQQGVQLSIPPSTRIATQTLGEKSYLYINGEAYQWPSALIDAILDGVVSTEHITEPAQIEVLVRLIDEGELIYEDE